MDLDIEILLTYEQPEDPRGFWDWLTKEALRELHSLRRFVLKVSVCRRQLWHPLTDPAPHAGEPLISWCDDDYANLKTAVTVASPLIQ